MSSERHVDALRGLSPDGQVPVFYVIGDEPLVYLLAREKPPYHSNDYNAAPIFEEQTVVDWLRQHKPPYAVWRFGDLNFDDFQRVVRDPLIYNEVIDSFVPIKDVCDLAPARCRRTCRSAIVALSARSRGRLRFAASGKP